MCFVVCIGTLLFGGKCQIYLLNCFILFLSQNLKIVIVWNWIIYHANMITDLKTILWRFLSSMESLLDRK